MESLWGDLVIKNVFKHFATITKHKWFVFKFCLKAGIPWRGLVHDLSKYSPTEFWESVKYYQGTRSPIDKCREVKGYSEAWLHHKGRNKHHCEYWYDRKSKPSAPIIPYVYVVEMICDNLAAGKIYKGKNWTNSSQLEYWNKAKDNPFINEKVREMLTRVYTDVSEKGIDAVITKANLRKLYKEYCEK